MLTTIKKWVTGVALIKQIAIGLVIGIVIALFFQPVIPVVKIFGDLFVKALKGVAPILVFFLVMNAMAQKKENAENSIQPIIELYMIATFCASLVGVGMSFLFPTTLNLTVAPDAKLAPPSGIVEVLHSLILSVVDNPVSALMHANYIGILAWAVILGIALRSTAGEATRNCLNDLAGAITKMVSWVIHFAPLGIMGLVADSVGTAGLSALLGYAQLLGVLVVSYGLVAFVMNPFIVYLKTRKNPYPLVWATVKDSGVYAFFTRSSAANIPVNLSLCKRLGLNPDTYTISIPLGPPSTWPVPPSPFPCWLWQLPIHWGLPSTCLQHSCSASFPPSAPAAPPVWQGAPSFLFRWPALPSALATIFPCRWWQ